MLIAKVVPADVEWLSSFIEKVDSVGLSAHSYLHLARENGKEIF